jgi:hypothetical protein
MCLLRDTPVTYLDTTILLDKRGIDGPITLNTLYNTLDRVINLGLSRPAEETMQRARLERRHI